MATLNLIASDRTIQALKRGSETRARLPDGGGLYLLLWADGGSHGWRFSYTRPDGRRNIISFGTYPDVTLAGARARRTEARQMLADGIDPSEVRKADSAKRAESAEAARRAAEGLPMIGSFEFLARDFYNIKVANWSPAYASRWIERLQADIFPHVRDRHASQITAGEWLRIVRIVQDRGAIDSAQKLTQYVGQVYRHGVAIGTVDTNPVRDLYGALKSHTKVHYPAVTTPGQARELMRNMMNYPGMATTRAALQISAMTFQRPGNIRAMRWAHVDLELGVWTIPAAEMKRRMAGKLGGPPHIVPLSTQAIELLRHLRPMTSWSEWVFPGRGKKAKFMSENTMTKALHAMGWSKQMTSHGFRAMARTMLVEHADINPEVVEAQLAHAKRDPLGRAYDRAEYLDQRREMMQKWSDYLYLLANRTQAG